MGFAEAAATWAAYGTAWGGLVAVGALDGRADSAHLGRVEQRRPRRDPDRQPPWRARPVALTRTSAKADALRGHGAAAVVATAEQDVVAEVKRLTDGKGADLVFDPVGGPEFATLARAVTAGGTLVLYGALDPRPTVVPPFDIFARDLTVRGVALPALARDDAEARRAEAVRRRGPRRRSASRPTIARTLRFRPTSPTPTASSRRASRSARSSSPSDFTPRKLTCPSVARSRPTRMGDLDLPNRIVMAPLTRMRAGSIDHVPDRLAGRLLRPARLGRPDRRRGHRDQPGGVRLGRHAGPVERRAGARLASGHRRGPRRRRAHRRPALAHGRHVASRSARRRAAALGLRRQSRAGCP